MMPIRNPRDRTADWNSERAMVSTLRMGRLLRELLGRRFRDAHEDVVERGARDLEVPDARPGDEGRQEQLRIAGQAALPEAGRSRSPTPLPAANRARPGDPSSFTRHRVAAVRRLDFVERAVEHLATAENHEDAVAHALGDVHVVRAEKDGRALLANGRMASRSTSAFTGSRPENGSSRMSRSGREIDRGDELDLLRHALRERLDAADPARRPSSFGQSTDLSQNRRIFWTFLSARRSTGAAGGPSSSCRGRALLVNTLFCRARCRFADRRTLRCGRCRAAGCAGSSGASSSFRIRSDR